MKYFQATSAGCFLLSATAAMLLIATSSDAFSTTSTGFQLHKKSIVFHQNNRIQQQRCHLSSSSLCASQNNNSSSSSSKNNNNEARQNIHKSLSAIALASALSLSTLSSVQPANAVAIDPEADMVTSTVQSLKAAAGNPSETFNAFENVRDIITEGKGVGGSINYNGVQLDRGYIADEDTTIYNPGLTLLTESEKTRLMDAILENRKSALTKKNWSAENEKAYDFLKGSLDPLHMVELKGYLGVLPFFGAAVYLVALAVQQIQRDFFSTAYIASAVIVFLPIAALIAKGP